MSTGALAEFMASAPAPAERLSISPAEFMQAAPAPLAGNTPWAGRYAAELRDIVVRYANGSDRNLQRHLGPSEIGAVCHRQVAGKLAQLPATNHVVDPWASIMGTAGHAWMEDCFTATNATIGRTRWLAEFKVRPTMGFEEHPGTGDLYDVDEQAVDDHKFLGVTSMNKLRRQGPPRHYKVQFLLYALGFIALGLPVKRIVLIAWPRTESSLDGMYVWEEELTVEHWAFLRNVVEPELRYRKDWAAALVAGTAQLRDVPADTTDCIWCPFFRPQTARDDGPGCPGHAASTP